MLDPHDALFTELGNKYVARMAEEWGTDHIYQTDTYNEMEPPTSDPGYLATSSKNVFDAMEQSVSRTTLAGIWVAFFSRR